MDALAPSPVDDDASGPSLGAEDRLLSCHIVVAATPYPRALGSQESVHVDSLCFDVLPGDRYLLCSDGLTGELNDDTIAHIIQDSPDLDKAVQRLVAAANEEGGADNISAVLARIEPP